MRAILRATVCVLMIVLLVSPAGCDVIPPKSTTINKAQAGTEISLLAYASFTITLEANPSLGYGWEQKADISDTTVLKQDKYSFENCEDPRVEGVQTWNFSAMKPGTATITLQSLPQVYENPAAEPFTLTVKVSGKG